MVEAGANRKMKVLLKGWMIGGDAKSLVNAIDQRATGAQFGFDKSPVVLDAARRAWFPACGERTSPLAGA